ncbi:hypothetical protein SRHO_G00010100 [Serrasalmus rhombeus]
MELRQCGYTGIPSDWFTSILNVAGEPTDSQFQTGPNCYVDASRTKIIPGGEPVWVDSCTKCRCHDGQDAGYWEGNRLATCTRLRNCTPSSSHKNTVASKGQLADLIDVKS